MSGEALRGHVFVAHLMRCMSPDERAKNDQAEPAAFAFTMRVSSHTDEPRRMAAVADEFGDMLVGMGRTHKGAVADLIEAVQAVVDHHIAHGTNAKFMAEHFEAPNTFKMPSEPADPRAEALPWLDHFEADHVLDFADAATA